VRPPPVQPALRSATALLVVAMLLLACGHGGPDVPAPAPGPPPDPALVHTATGEVRGLIAPDHRLFAGIPYAAPPVGPLRWQPPMPAAPWPQVRDATQLGPRCVQDPGDLERGRNTSEDCLTLNVWTPPPAGEKRPVMVWIHGGGFFNGSGGIYDAQRMTTRGDIVVVTLNYRLGALGFLAHPSFGPPGAVGNYGLADQQAALRWVRDNIANFGGDPDKVTIAGESAGGISVCDHLVAPGSTGLFRAAIIQSGPCQAQVALPAATRISLDYARAVGCADPVTAPRCLRAVSPDRLRTPVWYYRIGDDPLSGPVTGTAALPVDPMAAFATGAAAKVPVLIGTNRDEFTLFVALQWLRSGKRFPQAEYPHLLSQTFGADAPAVAAHYPLARYAGSTALAYSAAVTDGVFACVADRMSQELALTNPVYSYEFSDPAPPTPDPIRTLPFPVGASHSLELRYLFAVGGAPPPTPAQQALSDQMIDYWAKFVVDGKPDVPGQPEWPELGTDPAAGNRLSLRPDGSRLVHDFEQRHQCGFWAGLKG
jgi:para-nitrobenzyl esterase